MEPWSPRLEILCANLQAFSLTLDALQTPLHVCVLGEMVAAARPLGSFIDIVKGELRVKLLYIHQDSAEQFYVG